MAVILRKNLGIFLLPALPLIGAFFTIPRVDTLSPGLRDLLPHAPYAAAALAMLLSLRFHRGRVFLAALIVVFCYRAFDTVLQGEGASFRARTVFLAVALLPALNLAFLSVLREKSIASNGGIMRIAFFLIQLSLIEWVIRFEKVGLVNSFFGELFGSGWNETVPQPVIGCWMLCWMLMLLRLRRMQTPVEAGLLGVSVALALVCLRIETVAAVPLFSGAAGAILLLALLQDSYEMAFRDDLTGLPSRRALNERLTSLGRRYAMAMVDIDHFKSFNDTHGHDVGDQVLKMVARKIQGVSGGGTAYRYGGEEFTILFPRRSMAQVVPHLEELRKAIREYPLRIRGEGRPKNDKAGKTRRSGENDSQTVSVTVSIGVSESGGGSTPAAVLKEADQALYRAKRKGRNQVSR